MTCSTGVIVGAIAAGAAAAAGGQYVRGRWPQRRRREGGK